MNPLPAIITRETIILDGYDIAVAGGLVLVAGIISLVLRLGQEKSLLLAAVRCVIQLLIIGYVLEYIFEINTFWAVVPVVLFMMVAATHASVRRPKRTLPGAYVLAFVSLMSTGLITIVIVTTVIVQVDPWYTPQYMIPLLGMILGNSLTALSLAVDYVLESISERRSLIEMELSHGATRWEAARDVLAEGIKRGMIPLINNMSVVGIVALPGMMTGQILQGADPMDAVMYQIMVMFMLAAATALAGTVMTLLVFFRLFNSRHQLESGVIKKRK